MTVTLQTVEAHSEITTIIHKVFSVEEEEEDEEKEEEEKEKEEEKEEEEAFREWVFLSS